MKKAFLTILIITAATVFARVNVGFYSLTQNNPDNQNVWIGYALADIMADRLSVLRQINVITDDDIYEYLSSAGKGTTLNTRSINSFTGDIKEKFDLDFIVTGNYTVNPDGSLPVNVVVYDLNEEFAMSPIVIQGFANDLPTIVSFLTHPICTNMKINLSADEVTRIKQIDVTARREGMDNLYKGKIALRIKDYRTAADAFEEVFRQNPANTDAKKMFDLALSHFYGDGLFAYHLLETDRTATSPFRKQYMITRHISKNYTPELTATNLSARNMGDSFDINLNIELTLAPNVFSMTSDIINKFSSGGQAAVQGGVFNPRATNVLTEREIFENNVENFMITVRFLDRDGNVIHQAAQSFKNSFQMTYSGAVRDRVFHKRSIETSMMIPSVSRNTVRNTSDIKITVE